MTKLLFLTLFSFSCWASVRIEMQFPFSSVKQGELVEAKLSIQGTDAIEPQKLRGQTLGKTVYFYEVSSLMKREGVEAYEADAKVIFVKVPEGTEVPEALAGSDVVLSWGSVQVVPTEGAKELLFGTFEVKARTKWLLWTLLSLLGLSLVGGFAFRVTKRMKERKARRLMLIALKSEILGCKSYDEVVALWKRKHRLVETFPHIQDSFAKLEETLNKHQFKQRQSEAEKIESMESYRKFVRSVEGGFSGI